MLKQTAKVCDRCFEIHYMPGKFCYNCQEDYDMKQPKFRKEIKGEFMEDPTDKV